MVLDTIPNVNQIENMLIPIPSFQIIWMLNIELMPSNLTSLHLPDYADAHTGILLFSNLYHCIEDLHIYISTNLFSKCSRYIEWYCLNSPYIVIIWKCALYIHLFQPNYTRATWWFCVLLPLQHIYQIIAQDMRILWCYTANQLFYI